MYMRLQVVQSGLNATVTRLTYIHTYAHTYTYVCIQYIYICMSLFTLTDFYNEICEVVSLGQVMQQQLIGYVEANFFVAKLEIVDTKCGAH